MICLTCKKRSKKSTESTIPFQKMTEKPGSDEGETELSGREGSHEVEEQTPEKREELAD